MSVELSNTGIAFDQSKQAAIVGWVLQDDLFCMQCMTAVKSEWFTDPHVGKLYAATQAIFDKYHRKPTPQELEQWRPFLQDDPRTRDKIIAAMKDALLATRSYPLDALREEMTNWMRTVIFAQAVERSVQLYNAKKVEDAWAVLEDATLLKGTASFEEGINAGFEESSKRVLEEHIEREEQAKRLLQYGVGYLDDALGGIIPNDLIVLGAKTGAGKTQLATSIALANAEAGNQVYYFALEAENNEIERRIAYGVISGVYYKTVPKEKQIVLSYTDWRMCKLNHVLGDIEKTMRPVIEEKLKNLHTLYRTSGNFDLRALERHLMKIIHKARLIVIDHLHYVDTSEEENVEYKRVIKMVRDIVLRFGVPIIVIAHLRKTQGRGAPNLMPGIEDFHGTSDVPKVATTCIMLAPARDQEPPQPYLWPTYVGVVKSRLDGSRTRFTGLTHFDQRTSKYLQVYKIGAFDWAGNQWDEKESGKVPPWAQHAEEPKAIHTGALRAG